jgi:hypothetical protein
MHGLNQLTHHFLAPYFFSHAGWLPLPDEFTFKNGKIKDVEVLIERPPEI